MTSLKLIIRTTIFLTNSDPEHVIALVEYADRRLGITRNGLAVGDPWKLAKISQCIEEFWKLSRPRNGDLGAVKSNARTKAACT